MRGFLALRFPRRGVRDHDRELCLPLGPRVTPTASASLSIPACMAARASWSNRISRATARTDRDPGRREAARGVAERGAATGAPCGKRRGEEECERREKGKGGQKASRNGPASTRGLVLCAMGAQTAPPGDSCPVHWSEEQRKGRRQKAAGHSSEAHSGTMQGLSLCAGAVTACKRCRRVPWLP